MKRTVLLFFVLVFCCLSAFAYQLVKIDAFFGVGAGFSIGNTRYVYVENESSASKTEGAVNENKVSLSGSMYVFFSLKEEKPVKFGVYLNQEFILPKDNEPLCFCFVNGFATKIRLDENLDLILGFNVNASGFATDNVTEELPYNIDDGHLGLGFDAEIAYKMGKHTTIMAGASSIYSFTSASKQNRNYAYFDSFRSFRIVPRISVCYSFTINHKDSSLRIVPPW